MSVSARYAVGVSLSEPYQTLTPWFDTKQEAETELARLQPTTQRLLSIARTRTEAEAQQDAQDAAEWWRHSVTYHSVIYMRNTEQHGLIRARGPTFALKGRAQECADRLRGDVRTGTFFFDAVDAPGRLELIGELQ